MSKRFITWRDPRIDQRRVEQAVSVGDVDIESRECVPLHQADETELRTQPVSARRLASLPVPRFHEPKRRSELKPKPC